MKKIKSQYIVKLIDYFYDENYEGYCIVMELCDSDLRKLLNKYKPKGLPLELIKKIFLQLNDALKAMLEIDSIHRDLKPENILIKYKDNDKLNFDIRLTDFGLSAFNIKSSIQTYSIVGTQKYCAPEIETSHYNNKCDLWSLGVILYELYTNKYIFDFGIHEDIEINRKKGKINKTDNKLINNLINKIIKVKINERIKWDNYFEDEFFKVNNNLEKIKEFENKYLTGKTIKGIIKEYNEKIYWYDFISRCSSLSCPKNSDDNNINWIHKSCGEHQKINGNGEIQCLKNLRGEKCLSPTFIAELIFKCDNGKHINYKKDKDEKGDTLLGAILVATRIRTLSKKIRQQLVEKINHYDDD